MITLVHPVHGQHNAYSDAEVVECKKHGWTVREEAAPEVESLEPVVEQVAEPEAPTPARAKPGPKPKAK